MWQVLELSNATQFHHHRNFRRDQYRRLGTGRAIQRERPELSDPATWAGISKDASGSTNGRASISRRAAGASNAGYTVTGAASRTELWI